MRKQEFLDGLRARFSDLPKQEAEERLHFYAEMIDDRIEEGVGEEEAVAAIGSADEIAAQIVTETPRCQKEKEKTERRRRPSVWVIVLLVLGSPIWLSLIVSAFAVVLSLFATLWSLIVSLWAIFASLIGCAIGGIVAGVGLGLSGFGVAGIALIGAGCVCAGASIFLFFGCRAATEGALLLMKKLACGLKRGFEGKERES